MSDYDGNSTEVQSGNKNYSLLAVVLNQAPWKPVWSSHKGWHLQSWQGRRWEGQLLCCCQGEEWNVSALPSPLEGFFSHSCPQAWPALLTNNGAAFIFIGIAKYPLSRLSKGGSVPPCVVSFSCRLHWLAALGLIPECGQEGMGTNLCPCLHLGGTQWV